MVQPDLKFTRAEYAERLDKRLAKEKAEPRTGD